jgi:cation transport ATPase
VTILGGDLAKLPWLIGLARKTLSVARLNLFWAFFYNGIGLALAVGGLLHPLFGAVSMMLSSLLVAIHSQRLARYPLPMRGA